MKIALYTGTFVKDKDGVARTLYEFVRCIKDMGHKVSVWSPEVTEGIEDTDMTVQKMPSIPVVLYPDYKLGFFGPGTKKQLDGLKPDIIHVSTPDLVGREFLLYGRRNNIPVVSVYHTDFPSYLTYYQLSILTPPVWSYLKWFYNNSIVTLVPTKTMEKRLRSKGIHNTIIWSRGIKDKDFSPRNRSDKIRRKWGVEEKKVVLYSGRFVWYKDLKVFISVYERIKEKYDNEVAFVLLGSGPAEEELKNSMPDAIFPGYLKGKDLGVAYASGDILLFPSTTETFGNVVQEALASGIPAIVSDVGGCKDIVNISKGGLVAKAKDTDSFYQKISTLIDNDEILEKLRKNGLEFAKSRSWDNINRSLLDKYEQIINEC